MAEARTARFDEVLDAIESLSDEQQETLIEIVRRRQVDRRRDEIAASIEEARKELARGEVHRGSVDDLLADI